MSLRSVQDWEAGVTLPTAERLEGIVRALLEAGGLRSGQEAREALDLWTAVARETPRMHAPFDEEWFAGLLTAAPQTRAAEPATGRTERVEDWGEAPDTAAFVGRGEELALLQRWVLEERCRLVALLGLGGIGKTSLAAWVAQKVAPTFERVYWRSLRNAPVVGEWLAGAIGFFSDQQLVPPVTESEQITALLQLLRTRRCLLVLDNSETLFEPGQGEGRYRAGMDGYGRVLQAVGETSHQSCLVLTSREAPPELAVRGRGVRVLELHGLGVAEAQALLRDKHLTGDTQAWLSLVDHYGGNGLALKIVGETIRQVYDGNVAGFMRDAVATYGTVFGDIRRLLDVQAERLSPVERDVLRRLAVEREPIALAELTRDVAPGTGRSTVVDAIEALRRRSLVERGEHGATFTLQSMVLEYVTDRLVETAVAEIGSGDPEVLAQQPLMKAQAKDYVRQTQERLIGTPVVQRLTAQDTATEAERRLLALLDRWRDRPVAEQGYGPGNVVNLLRLLRGDLRGMNLSRLSIRQAYLQGVEAQDASLSGAHLSETVLAEAFAYPVSVALSADGAFLAAGTPSGELRLWRVADRTPLLAVHEHTALVHGVALSETGQLLASASFDGTIRLWEVPTGRPLAILRGHSGGVRGVALASDGRLAASAGDDGTLMLWDGMSGQPRATLHGHSGAVTGVALSADGRMLASGGVDGTVRLWDTADAQPLATLHGHIDAVWCVALAADGGLVASGGEDGSVRVWDTANGQGLAILYGHTGLIRALATSRDGRLVASGGIDGTVRLWDTLNGELMATLQGHTDVIRGVAITGDGALVASGGADGTLRLWEAGTGQPLATLQGHTGSVWGVALTRGAELVASGGADGVVQLWDGWSGQLLTTLHGHAGAVYGVAVALSAPLVASSGADGTVRVWEAPTGNLLRTIHEGIGVIRAVALSGDGQLVASGGADGAIRLWDTTRGQALGTLRGHTGFIRAVVFTRDGRFLASGGGDGTVNIWDVTSRQRLIGLHGHSGSVWAIAFSEDGRLIATGGVDGTVRLWSSAAGELLATLHGHIGAVYGVVVSEEGRLLASGGADGTVRLWSFDEPRSGQPMLTLQAHSGSVEGLAIDAAQRLLASCGQDGLVRLWDAASGACLRTLRRDRPYQRLEITGLTGVTEAQRAALLALGAFEAPA